MVTDYQLSIFRNIVHWSSCWVIKSTKNSSEFLALIRYYYLVKYYKDDEKRLTKVGNMYYVIFEDSVTN